MIRHQSTEEVLFYCLIVDDIEVLQDFVKLYYEAK